MQIHQNSGPRLKPELWRVQLQVDCLMEPDETTTAIDLQSYRTVTHFGCNSLRRLIFRTLFDSVEGGRGEPFLLPSGPESKRVGTCCD